MIYWKRYIMFFCMEVFVDIFFVLLYTFSIFYGIRKKSL
jgi:hypothetical protein